MVDATGGVNTQFLPASLLDASGKPTVSPERAQEISSGIQARAENLPEAQKSLFLALLSNPDFSPNASTTPENIDRTLDVFERAAAILANSAGSVDNDKVLARTLVELHNLQRKDALNNRLSARTEAKAQLQDQAGKLNDSADELLQGAIVNLVLTTVSAAITIVSSAISIGQTGIALGSFDASTATQADTAKLSAIGGKASNVSQLGGGISSLGSGAANFASTQSQAAAKEIESEGAILAAEAEETKSEGDIAREQQQSLDETTKQLIAFIKELRDAEVEQMAAITRG